jgi:hypothetical protein
LGISLPVFMALSWLTQRPVKWSFRGSGRLGSLRESFRRSGRGGKADH